MEVFTLIRANIRHKRGSFFSVIILMFIIATALTTIISVNQNISKRSGEALDAVGLGDLVITISDLKCTNEMLSKVKNNKNVNHVEVIPTISTELTVNGTAANNSIFIEEYEPKKHPYQVYTENGMSFVDNPELLKTGEIYVPISYKNTFDCELGDKISMSNGNDQDVFKIKGFIEEPFCGSETISIKFVFLGKEDFNRLYQTRITSIEDISNRDKISGWYLVNVFKNGESNLNINDIKISINQDSGIVNNSLVTLSKELSSEYTLLFIKLISGILYTFTILLFIVVLIVMGHSISTGFEMDYVNIGVLKSQGFTKGVLRKVYIYQYLFAQIIGVMIGLVFSLPAIHLLNGVFVPLTGLLASEKISIVTCGILILFILFISFLFVLIKTRKVAEISPMRAISGGRESIYFSSRLNIPVDGKLLNLKLAFRQLTTNKKQYVSSGLIVAILVYFMITITTLNSCMNEKSIQKLFGGAVSDLSINYLNFENKQKQIEEEINGISPIKKKYNFMYNYFVLNDEEYLAQIHSDPSMFYSIIKGRAPLYDNEIVITEIVSKDINKTIGDSVKITCGDKTEEYLISGIYQSISDMGKCFGFSMDAAKKIDPNLKITSTDYEIEDSTESTEIAKLLSEEYGDSIEVVDVNSEDTFEDTILETIQMITYIIYVISIIFIWVVVLIVCSKMFLKEKKDFGIYKAFGFTTANLRLQFALRFLLVALIGSILGIITNVFLNNKMMGALLKLLGISNYVTEYSMLGFLVPSTLISICFFLFSYLLSGKIKRVDTKSLIVE